MLNLQHLKKVKEYLANPSRIVIVMHKSPDGDAVGSSLGLSHYLSRYSKKVDVITPDSFPDFLYWMRGTKKIINCKKNLSEAEHCIRSADIIFCLDFNSLSRIEDLGNVIKKSEAVKIMIDHHPQPEDFADLAFHDTAASSTAELVFDFINESGDAGKINQTIANCLYAGIMTDSGSFRYPSTTIHTHEVAAQLIARGAENSKVHQLIDDNNREARLRLTGYTLLEKMKILPEFASGFISLTLSDLKRFDYKEGDTEGFVNLPISVKGILFSALFTELPDGEIKISFRSRNKFDVNIFARKHFKGGGHQNASGGRSDLTMDETILKFLGLLSVYKNELRALR
jgi:bifunctional oligoribonuclease and PAP phosphatase NrnA